MDLDLDEVWLLQAFPCNVASGRGDTPLHEAVREGRAAVVELLAANAPLDVQNKKGWGPQFGRDPFGSFLERDRLSGDRNPYESIDLYSRKSFCYDRCPHLTCLGMIVSI